MDAKEQPIRHGGRQAEGSDAGHDALPHLVANFLVCCPTYSYVSHNPQPQEGKSARRDLNGPSRLPWCPTNGAAAYNSRP